MSLGPDWVLVGWRDNEGGYWVLASVELTHGELTGAIPKSWVDRHGSETCARPPSMQYELTVGLSRYVMVTASSYGEAMAGIFGTWDPDRQAPPDQIANARRALGDH
jgi:hypothetical protein